MTRRLRWRVICLLLASLLGGALAQNQPAVTFGYGGAIVADSWNPLRVVSRNSSPSVLEIAIDQGSLLSGEIPYHYRAELPGGTGLVNFVDDVYLPVWRTLQWRLSSEERLLASGSLAARDADTRPLQLIVSQRPGDWRPLFADDARVLERNGPDLPVRAAAYDGVATIIIDGTTAPPRPEAVLAAAATGATVVLVGDLPSSYADVDLLAGASRARYGSGVVVRAEDGDARSALARNLTIEDAAFRGVLAESLRLEPPETVGTGTILAAGALYAVAVLLALRFGRLPGVAAALALSGIASFAAWSALRPAETSFRTSASVEVGSGGVGRLTTVTELLTLPAGEMLLTAPGRPLEPHVLNATPNGARVPLARWGTVTLAAPPTLGEQRLAWNGPVLVNRSAEALADVYVLGLGPQGRLAAGAELEPSASEEAALPLVYDRLLAHLPQGTALARSGEDVIVALPDGGAL